MVTYFSLIYLSFKLNSYNRKSNSQKLKSFLIRFIIKYLIILKGKKIGLGNEQNIYPGLCLYNILSY